MDPSGETREQLKEQLLAEVPESGEGVGNSALMRSLGWPRDQYWDIRGELIGDEVLERRRGRGGSVRRIVALPARPPPTVLDRVGDAAAADSVASEQLVYDREATLYQPMREVIVGDWARDRQDTPLTVEITAAQGRRQTGGRWSRPDIVSVDVKTYLHLPGKYIDVTTFEVKPVDAIDVAAVYEALAHLRSATHSYVLLHVPDDHLASLQDTVNAVCEVARFHGIGVIVAEDPSDYTTWDEREIAHRREPDPARLDEFLSTQLSSAGAKLTARSVR